MDQFFAALGRFVVRFRYLVVLVWLALVILASAFLPSLGSEINNDNSQFLPATAPSSVAASLDAPIVGNPNTSSQVLVVAARGGAPLTVADEDALVREVVVLRSVPRVISARVLAISRDREAAQIVADVQVNQADVNSQKVVVADVVATFPRAHVPAGLTLHVAGPVATNVANQENSVKTGNRIQGVSFLFVIVLLILVFRSLLAPVVTLLAPAFALLVSTRLIGALGADGLKISEITEVLLIVLMIGAGTDYGLFLVYRVREEVRRGMDAREAVRYSLVRVGESISASAGTVIFALLSLLLASFGIYRDLGIPLAVGVAVMLLAGLTLLPALLAIFGRTLFWPFRLSAGPPRAGTWGRVAARLVRRPVVTLASGVVVFSALAAVAFGYHSGGFGGALSAPAGTDAAAGNALVSKHFPQASANPGLLVLRYDEPVWEAPARVGKATAALEGSGQFTQFLGPLDPNGTSLSPAEYARLHTELGPPERLAPAVVAGTGGVPTDLYNAYRATAGFISADGDTVQFEVTLKAGGQQSTAALDATPTIRAVVSAAARASGAVKSGVAGEAAALYDVSSTSDGDLVHIIPVAIVAIGILLALVLRSAVAPLYLIVSVGLSYLASLGVSTLVFIDIAGNSGISFILPFLMFIFLLALGEDYNILVMTRIREEAHKHPLREAVIRAVGMSGPTVTSAGLVLAGSFAVLAFVGGGGPGGGQIQDIGFGLAIGILMDTFLVRTLLVPSVVAILGRWNWWPAQLTQVSPALQAGTEAGT
ncbi:MAG TPA: MMPL family transporter [Acidimicrobiales bacterium]|nr:MMPL family transporter [Acidimicrobiales bacterium]